MKAGTVSEREFLSVSSYVFLAFQEKNHKQTRKKKKKKSLKNPIKVYLRFLEGGLNLAQLWQQDYCAGVVLSTNLPPAPSFPALHYSTKANLRALSAPPPLDTNLRALSAPPSDILAKSRIEAVNHKAQKHEFFQSLKQMHPICTHPL